ncbi:Transposase, Mutator family [Parapedobacter composti]|uniref:Transposase, Mutator family n=1 Tax=Parapedobacter composti TaxID=623281 RepID=A0A1I1EHM4_9SPHI|nr:Transposase, Mutator family [Parapedobacter composti]
MKGLYDGQKMGGTHLLESMLEGELNHHLQESKASGEINRKNWKTKKTARSLHAGHYELESGRDRNGTFEPKIVPRRQLIIQKNWRAMLPPCMPEA